MCLLDKPLLSQHRLKSIPQISILIQISFNRWPKISKIYKKIHQIKTIMMVLMMIKRIMMKMITLVKVSNVSTVKSHSKRVSYWIDISKTFILIANAKLFGISGRMIRFCVRSALKLSLTHNLWKNTSSKIIRKMRWDKKVWTLSSCLVIL